MTVLLTAAFLIMDICGQQTISGTIVHDNITRNYRLRLPANHTSTESLPLVINFHGYTSNAFEQEIYSNMNSLGDVERFAICYPNGIQNAWNVGWNFGSMADDIGFVSALIDDLIDKYNFDKNRIYACGMSNGGFLSYYLACRLSHKIAAIASVTGSMIPSVIQSCNPQRSMPVMEIHGTADNVVPFDGAQGLAAPVDSVITFWTNNNKCMTGPSLIQMPNTNINDGSTVEKYIYSDCQENMEVVLYKIIGGGHTWPGANLIIGATNQDINANVEIWNFFKKYSLPNTTLTEEPVYGNLTLHPNPAYDVLHLKGRKDFQFLQIFDLQGNVLIHEDDVVENSIHISHLRPGLYILKAFHENQLFTLPFVKM